MQINLQKLLHYSWIQVAINTHQANMIWFYFTKIGSNKILLLEYTYHINRNIFQNYTIHGHLINNYDSEVFFKNWTSNGYCLQSVYNGNAYIGIISELPQAHLASYDTNAQPFVYTCSENIDITDNQTPLNFTTEMNNEIVWHPTAYNNAVFDMISGTGNFAFRQNTIHGGQPIVHFYSSTEACTFHGSCEIPNTYNKTHVYILVADIYNDIYICIYIYIYLDRNW